MTNIFPVRLGQTDREILDALVGRYSLASRSDAVRVSLRVVQELGIDEAKIKELVNKHMESTPEASPIQGVN